MMNLSSVVGSFSNAALTVTRYAAGTRANGLWQEGSTSQVVVDPAVVAPLRGKEVEVLPEGLRTKRALQVFSTVALQSTDEAAGIRGDRFAWGGETFEVQLVEDWQTLAEYWRAIATKVDVQ